MKDYMAPMEGITNYIYRNAYHCFYHPMDKYFTPFIAARPNKRLSFKEINEVSPDKNQGLTVIPQILTNNAKDFIRLARQLQEDYGHREVNLNLGCPSGTVTAKGKGSGFLAKPEKLDAFLDEIFSSLSLDISVKTRIGTDYDEEWDHLLKIYEKYPMKELIIHPRLQKDYYQNTPRLDAFRKAEGSLSIPLCYNGDLFTPKDYREFSGQLGNVQIFMFGRGLIANPELVSCIREQKKPDKTIFRQFHDKIYADYQELLADEQNVLFRMKELWNYMIPSFTDYGKYAKKIKKAQRLRDYELAIDQLFAQQERVPAGF